MRKKPAPARQAARPGVVVPGGPMRPVPLRKPARRPARPQPPPRLIPGGVMVPAPAARPAAHKKPVKRKLALGEAVACCAAEALAASLRLTGWPVSDADVLALYELTAGDEDEGATIGATLEAAAEHGLGPGFPVWRVLADSPLLLADSDASDGASFGGLFPCRGQLSGSVPRPGDSMPLILGLKLPEGPHAVCDDGAAWWSWGQPCDRAAFPDAVIEEAWQVTW